MITRQPFLYRKGVEILKFFSVSHFILKQISVILLSRIVEIVAVWCKIDTSFRAIQRTTDNDCPKALFTVIPAFAAQVIVCSSACFGTDKKVPFLL